MSVRILNKVQRQYIYEYYKYMEISWDASFAGEIKVKVYDSFRMKRDS